MEALSTTTESRIRVIPADPTQMSTLLSRVPDEIQIKVAAYCRVSTDNREQESSYEAQVDYFNHYISGHSNWELVSIYADPGISGKSTKRPEFQRMMKDAREGKIDRILAKSVSRFARNTLDCVACCRELRELGIGVYFEKESIDTMDPSSNLTLTIMASLAEEESRSISSNTKWGMRKKQRDGTYRMNVENLYGFTIDENKNISINEDEAWIVRRIFTDYASGMSCGAIAKSFNDEYITSKFGGGKWHQNTVRNILQNEKYMGDMRMMKTYRPDFLSRPRKNNGEVEAYYIENHHPAIIEPYYFKMVQYLIKKSRQAGVIAVAPKYSGCSDRNALGGRIFCGDCGSVYQRKFQTQKLGAVKAWVCIRHRDEKDCPCIAIKETVILNAVREAMTSMIGDKEKQMEICQAYVRKIRKLTFEKEEYYKGKIEELKGKIDALSQRTEDFEDRVFNAKLEEIRMEIAAVKAERDRVIPPCHFRRLKADRALEMSDFLNGLEEVNDENVMEVISKMIDRIVVIDNDMPGESVNINFYNGETINVKLVNKKKRKCKHRICYREEA